MSQQTVRWAISASSNQSTEWTLPAGPFPPHELDRSLGWPLGTINALHAAFSAKLPRLAARAMLLNEEEHWRKAGQIFRRGWPPVGEGSYPLTVATDLEFVDFAQKSDAFVVVDAGFAHQWPQWHRRSDLLLVTSETDKGLATVATILEARLQSKRRGPWIALGGGILTDIAAFAASERNEPIHLAPTTLLAMIDASVGGKCGVNFPPFGKNQVGRISFPKSVLLCHEWLQTLSKEELRQGVVEGLKHAFLSGERPLGSALVNQSHTQIASDIRTILALIQVKIGVVEEDPDERGRRAILNFGHTIGHALEAFALERGVDLKHGDAVARGMMTALTLSVRLDLLSERDFGEMAALLRILLKEAPTLPDPSLKIWHAIQPFLAQDKKNNERLRMVLLKGWSDPLWPSPEIPMDQLKEAFLAAFEVQ